MNTPVATWWDEATAALVGAGLAVDAADPDSEAAEADAVLVEEEVAGKEEDSLGLPSTAVALRVPQFRFSAQPACPCASFGFACMHWS